MLASDGRLGGFSSKWDRRKWYILFEGPFKEINRLDVQYNSLPLQSCIDCQHFWCDQPHHGDVFDGPLKTCGHLLLTRDKKSFPQTQGVNLLCQVLGLCIGPVQAGHDAQPLLLHLHTQGDPHPHLDNLPRQFRAEIPGFRSKCNASAHKHWALGIA
jgi:hypothetical protein